MNDSFSHHSLSTSTSLIRRAKNRNASAWERLAELYTPLVYRWSRQAGLQPHDTADIVQDVFRSVSQRFEVFRDDDQQASFRAWLWGITRNALREYFRKNARQPTATGGSSAHQAMADLPDMLNNEHEPGGFESRQSLMHRTLLLIRGDFEEKTWQAFWRLAIDEQSAAEIGRDLGMNDKAVRQAKYRVLCRLRDEISGC